MNQQLNKFLKDNYGSSNALKTVFNILGYLFLVLTVYFLMAPEPIQIDVTVKQKFIYALCSFMSSMMFFFLNQVIILLVDINRRLEIKD